MKRLVRTNHYDVAVGVGIGETGLSIIAQTAVRRLREKGGDQDV